MRCRLFSTISSRHIALYTCVSCEHGLKQNMEPNVRPPVYEYPRSNLAVRLLFYPTLGYNLLRNWWRPVGWPYFSRIDETVILGALPLRSMIDQLIKDENVGAVISLNADHELSPSWVAGPKAWIERGVEHMQIPVGDFWHSADVDDVYRAVKLIRQFEDSGKSVYVHCKAGRCRSATVVACYLMERHGWANNVVKRQLHLKRPQVIFPGPFYEVLCDYSRALAKKNFETETEK